MYAFLKNKVVLVTGGTGSFGQHFIDILLQESGLKKLIVLSRDELKQSQMQARITDPRIRFFLGDIRDAERLKRAFYGVDVVVHAAALKQVPALEYNPLEAIKTNVLGSQNIIDAAIQNKVEKVLLISTDKAVNPANLYGATKLCAEKLFIAANAYRGDEGRPSFSVVRYGNVVGSRGSLADVIAKQKESGVVLLTHAEMTRFWITLKDAVQLAMYGLEHMKGGELFIPKIPSVKVSDFIKILAPDAQAKVIGIRPGEKLHESLLTESEVRQTKDVGAYYVVAPDQEWWNGDHLKAHKSVPEDFAYNSNLKEFFLTRKEDISRLI